MVKFLRKKKNSYGLRVTLAVVTRRSTTVSVTQAQRRPQRDTDLITRGRKVNDGAVSASWLRGQRELGANPSL